MDQGVTTATGTNFSGYATTQPLGQVDCYPEKLFTKERKLELMILALDIVRFAESKGVKRQEFCFLGRQCEEFCR